LARLRESPEMLLACVDFRGFYHFLAGNISERALKNI
jgi:hypothetical protein